MFWQSTSVFERIKQQFPIAEIDRKPAKPTKQPAQLTMTRAITLFCTTTTVSNILAGVDYS